MLSKPPAYLPAACRRDGRNWKDAKKWFKMTPAEKAAAEAKIENKMNHEDGLIGQTLALQAVQDELAASGKLEQMDFFGFVWPRDEK